MERKLFVGDVVKLKMACMENVPGTLGVVYEEYNIGSGPGASIIFKNGNYDGFAFNEQEKFIEKTGHDQKLELYQFSNVMNLTANYRKGVFDVALGRTEDDIEQARRLC